MSTKLPIGKNQSRPSDRFIPKPSQSSSGGGIPGINMSVERKFSGGRSGGSGGSSGGSSSSGSSGGSQTLMSEQEAKKRDAEERQKQTLKESQQKAEERQKQINQLRQRNLEVEQARRLQIADQVRVSTMGRVTLGSTSYTGNALIPELQLTANEYSRQLRDQAVKDGLISIKDKGRVSFEGKINLPDKQKTAITENKNIIDYSKSYSLKDRTASVKDSRNAYQKLMSEIETKRLRGEPISPYVSLGIAGLAFTKALAYDIPVGTVKSILNPIETAKGVINVATNPRKYAGEFGTFLKNKPEEATGVVIANVVAPKVYSSAFKQTKDIYLKAGATEIPTSKVFAKEVLSGKTQFPLSSSVKESLKRFNKSIKDGMLVGQTSTIMKPSRVDVAKAGKSAQQLLEDPGIYVTPKGSGSPHFLDVAKYDSKITFNPMNILEQFRKKPSVVEIQYRKIGLLPKRIKQTPGFEEVGKYLRSQAGTGKAFITKRSEIGQGSLKAQKYYNPIFKKTLKEKGTSEIEAIIPQDTIMKNILNKENSNFLQRLKGFKEYTKYNGEIIPIREYKVAGGLKASSKLNNAKIKNNYNAVKRYTEGSSKYYSEPRYESGYKSLLKSWKAQESSILKEFSKYKVSKASSVYSPFSMSSSIGGSSGRSGSISNTSSGGFSGGSSGRSGSISNTSSGGFSGGSSTSGNGYGGGSIIGKDFFKPFQFKEVKFKTKKSLGAGYNIFVKNINSNEFSRVNPLPVTRSRALDIGTYFVDTSLARTFILKPSKMKAQEDRNFLYIPVGYYLSKKNKLRNVRLKQGNPYDFNISRFIEKKKYVGDTKKEIADLNRFQRSVAKVINGI